jgi:hypothetical protein
MAQNDELQLGLAVLDEPAAAQSDPAIVDLRLHQMAGKSGSADAPVKKLSRADKNAHQIVGRGGEGDNATGNANLCAGSLGPIGA